MRAENKAQKKTASKNWNQHGCAGQARVKLSSQFEFKSSSYEQSKTKQDKGT
jgi:hypothetical protein